MMRTVDDAHEDCGLGDVFEAGRFGGGEALYRRLVEQLPAVVYVDSDEQRPDSLYISPQAERLFGYSASAYIADSELWRTNTHPDDRRLVAEAWAEVRPLGQPFECEYRIRHADGRWLWVHDSAVPLRGPDGRVMAWQGLLHDVTAAKQQQDALRESEARHRALIENLPAVVYVVAPDDDRKTLYVSPHVEGALGYTQQEWLEQPDIWMELLHPEDREETLAAHDLHNETGRPWSREYRLIANDGSAVWFRDVATLVRDDEGRPLHWQGVQLDITELKQTEEELRAARDDMELRVMERTHELEEANEMMMLEIDERRRAERELRAARERYRLLAEHLPGVVYVWHTSREAVDPPPYTSPQITEILGFTQEEWEDPNFWETRLHPDDRDRVLESAERSRITGEPFSEEYRYLAKDGHIVWVLDEAVLLERDDEGCPKIFHGITLDITAREEAKAAARETELRYHTLTAQVPAVTYTWEPNRSADAFREMTWVSPQVETLSGYRQEEWTNPGAWERALHQDDAPGVIELARRVAETGEAYSHEYRVRCRDGSYAWIRDEGRLLSRGRDGRPGVFQGIMLDISEQKRIEQELREAERQLRTLVEQIPAVVYIELPGAAPGKSPLVYMSPQVDEMLGFTSDELIADPDHFGRLVHPDDRARMYAANDAAEVSGSFDQEFRLFTKDGRVVWVHSRAALIRDDEGRPLFWQGVALDVTAKHEAEDALRDLESRYGAVGSRGLSDGRNT
jgi:PAS domain S-box-containing protein